MTNVAIMRKNYLRRDTEFTYYVEKYVMQPSSQSGRKQMSESGTEKVGGDGNLRETRGEPMGEAVGTRHHRLEIRPPLVESHAGHTRSRNAMTERS